MKLIWDFDELFDFGEKLTQFDKFEKHIKRATKEIAKAFHRVLIKNTPEVTGTLKAGWSKGDNLAYRVREVNGAYEVEFSNDVEYAHWVNYGHRVKNSKNGPYYAVKRRTVSYYDGNSSAYFVYGHFFVEKSIAKLTNGSHELDNIIYVELEKWFRWCVGG